MPADVGPTLTCFSYLAVAQLLRISQFPEPNYGREVSDLQSAVAADGVMVATACRRLGVRARLASNPVGDDGLGRALADLLSSHGVYCQVVAGARTPSIVVITDDSGSRIWLPFLPDVASLLAELDLAVFSDAGMVYVDCYELLAAAAVRVIRNSVDVGRPIFVNLGGSSIPSPLAAVPLPAGATELVQTNLEEGRDNEAEALASAVRTAFGAWAAVVTIGSRGALALTATGSFHVPAYRVEVQHAHGAGAAVSAVLACGLLNGVDLATLLPLACAAGSWRCQARSDEAWPTFEELETFAATTPRLSSRRA